MAKPSPGGRPPDVPRDDRLDSWKEIAAYLQRDVTTVQRWEKREGMPVRRHVHDKLGSVYAFRSELDAWTLSRNLPSTGEDVPPESPPRSAPRSTLLWLLVVGTITALGIVAAEQLTKADYFWRNPLDGAHFSKLTDFGATEQAAALSRDGRFAAFLSDREGRMDVWVTQVGTDQFHNLTHGSFPEIVNPSVRTLGFSPDGALVTFWARGGRGSGPRAIGIWAVPILGGEPRPYLDGVAEFDWSADGTRLAYHTPGPGDPTFVRNSGDQSQPAAIFAAAAGLHAHFPLWSPDNAFIYFAQGSLGDAMDIWRIRPTGGAPERVTHHYSPVSYPVLLNDRTLMYLKNEPDGSGPWLYSLDLQRRVPHRLSAVFDRYTSLAASADGRRLVATLANPNGTLWRMPIAGTPGGAAAATRIALTTGRGFSPRYGSGNLVYVSSKGTTDGIWRLTNGVASELWSGADSRIIGGPEISADGGRMVFTVQERDATKLYVMNADGTDARVISGSLQLRGSPAWAPDGRSITSGANVDGTPHLFRISLDGTAVALLQEYSVDPVWSPGGDFLVYSGADIGTTFALKAVTAAGKPYPVPALTLTRGARRLRFFRGQRALVVLRGELEHQNLWLIDLDTGAARQLTDLPRGFDVRDFDVSADGTELVLERVQEQSNIVLIDRAQR